MDTMQQVMEENARLKQEVAGLKEKNDHLSRAKDMQNFSLSDDDRQRLNQLLLKL